MSKFKEGDRVRVSADGLFSGGLAGTGKDDVFTLRLDHYDDTLYIELPNWDEWWVDPNSDDFELVSEEEKMPRFKEGDRVRMITDGKETGLGSSARKGDVFTVQWDDAEDLYIELPNGSPWWLGENYADDFELVSEEEERMSKFKAGDRVVLVSDGTDTGLYCQPDAPKPGDRFIVQSRTSGIPFIRLPNGAQWLLVEHFVHDFELVSEEEKMPRFKEGDKIVKVKGDPWMGTEPDHVFTVQPDVSGHLFITTLGAKWYISGEDEECFELVGCDRDAVNHPSHYDLPDEVIKLIRRNLGPDGFEAYCKGNILKYVCRASLKNGEEDWRKAAKYMRFLEQHEADNGE